MKLEMEGREPLIVLFGLPIVTAAIVLGSMYLGRMQAEGNPIPSVFVEPKVTVTPRITAEMPQGAFRTEIQIPPAQIHQVVREVRVPDINVVNKVEPAPVQVVMPKAPGTQPQVLVIPAPLPLPMNFAATSPPTSPHAVTLPEKPLTETPASASSASVITDALTTPPARTAANPTETANVKPPPPPEPIQPTPVSTDARPEIDEADGAGKLLPPPRNLNGQPEPK